MFKDLSASVETNSVFWESLPSLYLQSLNLIKRFSEGKQYVALYSESSAILQPNPHGLVLSRESSFHFPE